MYENPKYLSEQIMTYIGNKRSLLPAIQKEIEVIKQRLNKEKLACVDLFSGSGIVARLMKQYSHTLLVNDLEEYSRVINECYLSNRISFDIAKYNFYKEKLDECLLLQKKEGLMVLLYAPRNDENIQQGERVFYTHNNAVIIDTLRYYIDGIEEDYRKFFLAPLLYEASVHVNTAGIFKGFYKDTKTGIGKFGGDGENALSRIKGKIKISPPILSNFNCDYKVYKEDANRLVDCLPEMDIAYIDPPYNQHPYGSNYFMLNLISKNKITGELSRVSGIPNDWNRSIYNKKTRRQTHWKT